MSPSWTGAITFCDCWREEDGSVLRAEIVIRVLDRIAGDAELDARLDASEALEVERQFLRLYGAEFEANS